MIALVFHPSGSLSLLVYEHLYFIDLLLYTIKEGLDRDVAFLGKLSRHIDKHFNILHLVHLYLIEVALLEDEFNFAL